MKILMINHFPLEGSGSGTYTKNIASSLSRLGHEVHVIMPENTEGYPPLEGVALHPVFFTPEDASTPPKDALPFNFPCFTTHPRSTQTFAGLTDAEFALYTSVFEAAIDEEIAHFRPDVIHGQHVWVLPALACNKGVPVVLTAHGTDLMGYDKWPELRNYADKAMEACESVVVISKDNKALVEQVFPQHAAKAVLMRNGYNSQVFFTSELDRAEELASYGVSYRGEELVLFAGKLTEFKGVDIALDAAALYEKTQDDILTVIAGDGTERENLEAQAAALGLANVHFIGNVDQASLQRLYAIADVDLVPSRREPFGLVAIEAMACGTPVIASNQGGLPDFVSGEVGALVEPENPEELSRAVIETLQRVKADPSWRERIAAYAHDNYSQDSIIKELEALYSKAMQ